MILGQLRTGARSTTYAALYIGYLFIGFDGISSKIYLGNGSVSQFSLFIPSGLLARATDILLLAKGAKGVQSTLWAGSRITLCVPVQVERCFILRVRQNL